MEQTTAHGTEQADGVTHTAPKSTYSEVMERLNRIASTYGGLGFDTIYSAFSRAGFGFNNEPFINNQRVKAINPLPADYSKEELGEYLQNPQGNELPLRRVSEGIKWTTYPFYKLVKTYADMATYRHYVKPKYIPQDKAKTEEFAREWRLVDKLCDEMQIEAFGHKVAGQALSQGKVFYTLRTSIDRSHNKVNYVFPQQLPSDWCRIIGFNSISGYTISFDMMYFLQPATDYRQYGTLFEPYIQDFQKIFATPEESAGIGTKYIYASASFTPISASGREYTVCLDRVNAEGEGHPEMFMQNGRWCYFVSLPINRVWTFEIDDTTAIVASPFTGLYQTFAAQADYEAVQLPSVMNPLIKIFTGEIPYYSADGQKEDDGYRLTLSSRRMFQTFWNMLMAANNTGGTTFFTAPVENIKSHDFPEAAGANNIASSFLSYGMSKTGLQALVPANDAPHQGVAEYSSKLESRFVDRVYRTLERMFDYTVSTLNLKYEWKLTVFGSVYTDSLTRADALKQLDKGDLSQHFILAALDNMSILDRLSMSYAVKGSGLLDMLTPPATAYTMSNGDAGTQTKSAPKSDTGGAPEKDEAAIAETKQEKTISSGGADN